MAEETATSPGDAGTHSETTTPTKTTPDRGDYEARLRGEPEFAVEEVKRLQRKEVELSGRMKPLERIEKWAAASDDPNAITEALLEAAELRHRIQSDVTLSEIVDRRLNGEEIPTMADQNVNEEFLTPEEKRMSDELQALREDNARLTKEVGDVSTRTATDRMSNEVDNFFETDAFAAKMTSEEKREAAQALLKQSREWSKTPEGRRSLSSLDEDGIAVVVLGHLRKTGKLKEIGERMSASRNERVGSYETDGPSSDSALTEPAKDFKDRPIHEAMEHALQKYGVRLS